jgi:predicted nucleic acid-binding protein
VSLGVIPRVSRDPADDMVIATALAGEASYLLTEDDDLLSLDAVGNAQIATAATFLAMLRSGSR